MRRSDRSAAIRRARAEVLSGLDVATLRQLEQALAEAGADELMIEAVNVELAARVAVELGASISRRRRSDELLEQYRGKVGTINR